MINGIKANLNSKPLRVVARPILGGLASGALVFGPFGAFVGATFGLFYQAVRTVVVRLSLDKIKEEISYDEEYLNETRKSAFNQGVSAGESYTTWVKTFIPWNAAFKEPIPYYAGLGAKLYVNDDKLIDKVKNIGTKQKCNFPK